jgi:4-amino-4-deoxy-L-arabinose transferase-like glycosyltransferase
MSRWLFLLVALSLALRVAWTFSVSDRRPYADERAYLAHAERLCEGEGYVTAQGQPTDFWPPGYPLALAALCSAGGHLRAGIALQIWLGVLTPVLVWLIGRRVSSESVARVAALFMAVYPTHVAYSALWLSEPLSTAAILAATLLLLRAPDGPSAVSALVAGALFGCAALTRPLLLPLVVAIPLWQLWQGPHPRRGVVRAALLMFGAVLVLGPWAFRNHQVLGRWSLSSTGAHNFLLGNHADALGGYRRPPTLRLNRDLSERAETKSGYRRGWEDIRRYPGRSLVRTVQKVTYLFALETDGVMWSLLGRPAPASRPVLMGLLALANSAYVFLVTGTLLGLLSGMPGRSFRTYFLVQAGCLVAVCMIYVADPRYHFALVPFASLFLARAIVVVWPSLSEGLRRGEPSARRLALRWAGLTAVFAVLMMANLALKAIESRTMPRSGDGVIDRGPLNLTREVGRG